MENAYFWIKLDTVHIAGPFKTEEEADLYILENSSDGLVEVWEYEQKGIVFVEDLTVVWDPGFTLQQAEK